MMMTKTTPMTTRAWTALALSPLLLALAGPQARAQAPAEALEQQAAQLMALAGEAQGRLGAPVLDEGDSAGFALAELGREKLVKGAPYCAEAVHETVQPLLDGNRIVRSQTSRLCRDGEGRTRQEVERGGQQFIYLRDPVSKESWMLDPQRKTARRLGLHNLPDIALETEVWRDYSERMREWSQKLREQLREKLGREPMPAPAAAPPAPPAPPLPAAVSGSELRVMRIDGPGAPGAVPPAPPLVALRAQHVAPRGPGVLSPLGSKEIEGLKVNGERSSWTIEAGKLGNEKPIVITRDVWTSPELMLTVASRDFDPRSGEVNYRLQKIRRGEPDAALMKVPADYERQPSQRLRVPGGGASSPKG